jgi:hypothetical protein
MQEAEGFLQEAGVAIKSTITDPALVSSFFFEQIPNLIGTGGFGALAKGGTKILMAQATEQALAKAGIRGAISGGAVMQGADIGTDTYNQIYSELKKLGELKEKGILTEAEFQKEKKRLLDSRER